jgi:hypothetical protein
MKTKATAVIGALAALLVAPAVCSADAVTDWNDIMLATFASQTPAVNPFAAGRFAAITQLAVFEAVNTVERDYHPYIGTLTAPRGASAPAAAIAAAHGVLTHYFPASAAVLDAARATSLAAILDSQAKTDGIAVGTAAAAALVGLRSNDGSAPPRFHVPASADAGVWQLTPGCPPAGGVLRHWQDVTPFGIDSSAQFRSPPPPSLTNQRYAADYREVKTVGGVHSTKRPQDRADVALFYNAVLAVAVWNPAARQIAAARGTSLSANARMFALLNMAINDGLVSSMETKYHYELWRPETAIRAGDADGNRKTAADPNFAPFIVTPCFPSYPSAHASGSYAARAVLESLFGNGPHFIELATPALPNVALQYTRLSEITDDIDDARVYGGIHFRFDQEAGACQGTRVGRFVSTHNLQRKQRHFFFGAAPWGDDEPRSAEAPQSFGFGRHRAPQHCGR